MSGKNKTRFSPTICVTHNCNLDCIYCYQEHDTNNRMTIDTAKKCIDWIFENVPDDMSGVEIGFIGGEPMLEFELIKSIIEYTQEKKTSEEYIFYATTNGTVLNDDMKAWLVENKDIFVLGLSLDGAPETHNHNRNNSFDKIDIDFFAKTWPYQGIKMTLSEYSLQHLAKNVKYAHSLGFCEIDGVNLFEGEFDWGDEKYIKMLIPQLEELVKFYVENDNLRLDQMMNRKLEMCEGKNRSKKKWCGIGNGAIFFDVDGTRRPCPFVTPMTFEEKALEEICSYDYGKTEDFIDDYCFDNCYIYPVCPHCAGANYLTQKTFKVRDKSKCKIQKLITLYSADLQAKRIIKNPDKYDEATKYNLINAIQKIKELYLDELLGYFV